MERIRRWPWRAIFSRVPLPMLALAASYGVWSFQRLFVPDIVAAISATAFETTYLALAIVRLAPDDRRRATLISVGAVVVSVIYNSLAALFEIRPALLLSRPLWADIALAVAHGLPLAVVAFLVADLLLHASAPAPVDTPTLSKTQQVEALALARNESVSTVWRKLKAGEITLNGRNT